MFVPVGLDLIKPRLHGEHRLAAQAEHPHARVLWTALIGDDSRLQQRPQMLAHRRCREAEVIGELAGPTRALAEKLDHTKTGRVSRCACVSTDHEDLAVRIAWISRTRFSATLRTRCVTLA